MFNLQTLHTERLHRSALRCIWSPGPNAGAARPASVSACADLFWARHPRFSSASNNRGGIFGPNVRGVRN